MKIANFDLAGTNKFIAHELDETEERTLCGLFWKDLKGQWEETGQTAYEFPGCLRCQTVLNKDRDESRE